MSSISSRLAKDRGEMTIAIQGRFTYDVHKEFRDAYERVDAQATSFIIDLAGTEYMDSAALGMLLLLRERAGGDRAKISIINCSKDLLQLIRLTNFQSLFDIS